MSAQAGITLFWLPLGAGGHSVRWNGRIYEAACALLERRAAVDLYHSALQVSLPPDAWVVEMTPQRPGPAGRGATGRRQGARLERGGRRRPQAAPRGSHTDGAGPAAGAAGQMRSPARRDFRPVQYGTSGHGRAAHCAPR